MGIKSTNSFILIYVCSLKVKRDGVSIVQRVMIPPVTLASCKGAGSSPSSVPMAGESSRLVQA